MTISITGLHFESDPKLKSYADKKIKKLLRYHSAITDIKVRLLSEKSHRGQEQDYYCEITIHVPGRILEIVDSERAMDKAIDKAVERMKRTLIKYKEKELSKQHKEGVFRKLIDRFRKD